MRISLKKIGATAGVSLVSLVGLVGLAAPAHAAAPVVTLTPSTGLYDQQIITVSVGPNTTFTPGAGINIIECAAGSTSSTTCDGNTIQGDTILVNADGSFSYNAYTLYKLPSPLLGETPPAIPTCDSTHACILYVGQNQNDFSAPKAFSASFFIADGPPAQTPETPYAIILPLGALGLLGGAYVVLRTRKKTAHAAA